MAGERGAIESELWHRQTTTSSVHKSGHLCVDHSAEFDQVRDAKILKSISLVAKHELINNADRSPASFELHQLSASEPVS